MLKSDISEKEFINALNKIYKDSICYSNSVKLALRTIFNEDLYLDNYNRQILKLLSKGIKTKNLINYLPLSISAIDKRKALLKQLLGLEKANDENLLEAARAKGLL